MSGTFYNCSSLTTIPQLNTSNVTDMGSMLEGCGKLATVPLLDTSNVKSMRQMFQYCYSLTSIPLFDTHSLTDASNMFASCTNLETIPALDFSNVTKLNYTFFSGGIKNILVTGIKVSFEILYTSMEHDAIVVLLNNLATVTTTQTLTMGADKLALLSDEEKAIATNKGWTLA